MMLRASVEAMGARVDVRAITDSSVDPLVEGGTALVGFVDAVLAGDDLARSITAEAIRSTLGPAGLVDAAGVIGTFSMMNRIADATGIPVGRGAIERTEDLRRRTGIDRFRHE